MTHFTKTPGGVWAFISWQNRFSRRIGRHKHRPNYNIKGSLSRLKSEVHILYLKLSALYMACDNSKPIYFLIGVTKLLTASYWLFWSINMKNNSPRNHLILKDNIVLTHSVKWAYYRKHPDGHDWYCWNEDNYNYILQHVT